MKTKIILIFSLIPVFTLLSCFFPDPYQIVREEPKTVRLSDYKTINLGWIDYPESMWSELKYKQKEHWIEAINNTNGLLPTYLSELSPGKKFIGSKSRNDTMPSSGDLFIKFTYNGIKRGYSDISSSGKDHLELGVQFIDIKTEKTIYKADMSLTSFRPFPNNVKSKAWEGRLDNEIYNLAKAISLKMQ